MCLNAEREQDRKKSSTYYVDGNRPWWPLETNGFKLGLGTIDTYTDAPGPASGNWRPLARWAARRPLLLILISFHLEGGGGG